MKITTPEFKSNAVKALANLASTRVETDHDCQEAMLLQEMQARHIRAEAAERQLS